MGQYMLLTMAEEFKKYKSILDREWEEFQQQLQREVTAFLSFQVGKRSNIGTKCNWNFVMNFASVVIYFFLNSWSILSNVVLLDITIGFRSGPQWL